MHSTLRSRRYVLQSWKNRCRYKELEPTCYHADLLRIFASYHEDDVPLGGVHIVIFQEEELVNAILLESAELDNQADSAS